MAGTDSGHSHVLSHISIALAFVSVSDRYECVQSTRTLIMKYPVLLSLLVLPVLGMPRFMQPEYGGGMDPGFQSSYFPSSPYGGNLMARDDPGWAMRSNMYSDPPQRGTQSQTTVKIRVSAPVLVIHHPCARRSLILRNSVTLSKLRLDDFFHT